MDLGVIISCCMSNPCPGWWEAEQQTNRRTNMDVWTHCNDFTLLRNDRLETRRQGKHILLNIQTQAEQNSRLKGKIMFSYGWWLSGTAALVSHESNSSKFITSCYQKGHIFHLMPLCPQKHKYFFPNMTMCTLQWTLKGTHTHTHNAWAVQCPHFFPALLGMSWIRPAFAPDPRPQKNTFSVRPHKRCSQCVCVWVSTVD